MKARIKMLVTMCLRTSLRFDFPLLKSYNIFTIC
nr:MAG TPA: hypothetical protein [Caudoviricetes sp.]